MELKLRQSINLGIKFLIFKEIKSEKCAIMLGFHWPGHMEGGLAMWLFIDLAM